MCNPIVDPTCIAKEVVKKWVEGSIEDSIAKLAAGTQQMAADTSTGMVSWWMSDLLDPKVAEAGTTVGSIAAIQSLMVPLVALSAFVAVVVSAARMAMTRRAQPLWALLQMMATVIVVTALTAMTVQVLLEYGNQFSRFALKTADARPVTLEGIGNSLNVMLMLLSSSTIVMLANLAQIAFMLLRAAVIPVLIAVLPFAASMGYTEAGQQWTKKILGWLLAFVLYKPMAAVLYAVGLRLATEAYSSSDGGEVMKVALTQVSGFIVIALCILLLPAMLKLVAPAAAVGSSSMFSGLAVGGAIAGAAVAGVGAAGLAAGAGAAGAGGAGVTATNVTFGASGGTAAVPPPPPPPPASAPGAGTVVPPAPAPGSASAGAPEPAGPAGSGSSTTSSSVPAASSGSGSPSTVSPGGAGPASSAPPPPAPSAPRSGGGRPGTPTPAPGRPPVGGRIDTVRSGIDAVNNAARRADDTLEGSS